MSQKCFQKNACSTKGYRRWAVRLEPVPPVAGIVGTSIGRHLKTLHYLMLIRITQGFPLWALLASAFAFWQPQCFETAKPAIVPLLGLVMFGMGLTLSGASFLAVLRRPGVVALGVGLQFLLMPFVGWLLAALLGLPPLLAVGVVLLGSCPGGTASNVICYLARGDVALSITLTAVSTLLAVLATPWLTWWYVGEMLEVPRLALLLSVVKMVLLPVLAGVLLHHFFAARLRRVEHFFPLLSMIAIVLIIAIIVALNRQQLTQLAAGLVAAVVLHNALGLLAGYGIPRLLGRDAREARTLAIEVGMQNSGLAVALATQHFAPMAALPGALFSIWHNLTGSLLAGWWARAVSRAGR